jgi:regulator of sigma E protease
MDILIKVLAFFFSLSILVIVHEFGHFIAAKAFKTRVEKFYLFFNPWFSIFKFKIKDTEYGMGWLPLGGYVKIAGMIDESMDKEQLKKPPQPWEFRSKPSWQRLIIMLGGVIMNVLLAVFIYIVLLFNYGEKYLPTQNLTDGIFVMDSVLLDVGIRTGDKIISIEGQEPPERFNEILMEMLYSSRMTVERDGKPVELSIPVDLAGKLSEKRGGGIFYRFPFIIGKIPDSSHNAQSGLKEFDMIVGINGREIKYFDEFAPLAENFKGQNITFDVLRDEEELRLELFVNEDGKIGVLPGDVGTTELEKMGIYNLERKTFTLLESIPAGITMTREQLVNYVRQFKLLFNPDTGAYKGLGGFITIGSFFPSTWDWYKIWQITAFLSIMLAILNILPIPALDGGHVVFLFYEIITNRKPSDKFMEYAQVVGMVILLALLVFANGNDVLRWIESFT